MMPVRRWLALVCAALLSLPVVRIGMADLRVEQDPAAARAGWPRHAEAWTRLGQNAAAAADWVQVTHAAHALLANSPVAGMAHRLLAQRAEAEGDLVLAARRYALAARRAPRDRVTHGWLARDAAAHGRFADAIIQLDELLRIAPTLFDEIAPSLATFVAVEEARTALVAHIGAHDTPWRARFLGWFAAQPDHANLLAPLFAPLRASAWPLTDQERSAWIERLLREGQAGQAQFLWIDGLPKSRRALVGNVFDGGFEWPADNTGFGWRVGRVPGASIRFDMAQGAGGRQALIVDFHDRRVPFAHLQQRLALPPGRFLLQGRVRLDGLRNERGLVWQVQCANGLLLTRSDRFFGSAGWREFAAAFERPSADCAAQTLLLRLDARIAPEQMIGGRVLFDDLRIVSSD